MRRFRSRLAKALFCLMLAVNTFSGAPMRPDEIEQLLASMNQQTIEHTVTDEKDDDL